MLLQYFSLLHIDTIPDGQPTDQCIRAYQWDVNIGYRCTQLTI